MILLPLLACLSASPVNPPECDPNDAKSCVQVIMQGEAATFTGQLLSFRRAAKLAVQAEQCTARVQVAVDEQQESLNRRLGLCAALRASDKETTTLRERLFQDELTRALKRQERAWYDKPGIWFGLGIAVSVALVWGATEALAAQTRSQ